MTEQLSFIPETTEQRLEREIKRLIEQSDRVRKSQYAQIGEMRKKYDDLKHRFEILESALCRGK